VVAEPQYNAGDDASFGAGGVNGCAGDIQIATTCGVSPEGLDFDVFFDTVFMGTFGCETSGSVNVPVPAGVLLIEIFSTGGCNGGPDPCTWSVTGFG
jgi:hypothetical protein